MPYLIYAIDFEGMKQIREDLRQAHRNHLKKAGSKLLASGALLDDDGSKIIGGMSILDTTDKSEAQKFADEDPYNIAGIRKETSIIRWRHRWVDGEFVVDNNSVN